MMQNATKETRDCMRPYRRLRLKLVTDAWSPQINGVANTYTWLAAELVNHVDVKVLSPASFVTVPMPTYPSIRLAVPAPGSIRSRIDAFMPDVIHIATEGPLGWAARRYCLKRKIPFTTAYHTHYPEYISRRFPPAAGLSESILRRFHNAAAKTLVASQELSDNLRERGYRRTVHWRRGIDVQAFSEGDVEEMNCLRPLFLYVGRLAIEKDIDSFLGLDLPGTKIVVGDGPERRRLEEQFPAVRFLGSIRGPRLGNIYRAADVFVFPSQTDTYGLVMAEALAAGVPVACYPGSGAREIFQGEACGVMSHSLQEAALKALQIPRSLCKSVGARHSTEASLNCFLELVGSVVRNPAHQEQQQVQHSYAAGRTSI